MLLRRRRSELLQLLRVNLLALLHNLGRLASRLRMLQFGLLLRGRPNSLRLLLLEVLAFVRLRLRRKMLLLLVVNILWRIILRRLALSLLRRLLLLLILIIVLLLLCEFLTLAVQLSVP